MPLYQYECDSCHAQFDDIRKYDERDQPAECPECGNKDSGKRVLGGYSVSAGGTGSSGLSSTPSCTVGGG